jgi:hypothetical protein
MNEKKIKFFSYIICIFMVAALFTGCASRPTVIDNRDFGASEAIQQELAARNERLESGIERIEDIIKRADGYNLETGDSLEKLGRLLQQYFSLVADLRTEVDEIRRGTEKSN